MRKFNALLVAGVVTLCLGTATSAIAGPNCSAEKASAQKASCSSSAAAKAELTSSSACTVKGSMASMFKQAPGTKAAFQKIDNGIVMTISAASAEYVPVVQKAVMNEIETMSTYATSACAVSSAKAAESCSFAKTASVEKAGATCTKTASVEKAGATCDASKASKASVEKAGATCDASKATKASVQKASVEKAGAGCCASKASVEKASMVDCPDWMKVLCGANCVIEQTAEGIRITWTTDKKDALSPLQAAGEQFHAEVSRL